MITGTMFAEPLNLVLQFVIVWAVTHHVNIAGLNPQLAINLLSHIIGA